MAKRFIGCDVHRSFIMVAVVHAEQRIVMRPRSVAAAQLAEWCAGHLTVEDEAVIEASIGCWEVYDQLAEVVGRVVVAHTYHVKLIASSFVKTNKRDATTLARLLAAKMVPEVWVPPRHVRELRSLIYHRYRLMRQRADARNRVRGTAQRIRLPLPEGRAAFDPTLWDQVALSPGERLRTLHALSQIATLGGQLKETEVELARISQEPPWSEGLPFLIQLPGIGLITALTILSAIGEIGRFPSPKRLVGYAGLGARVSSSGQTKRTGGITKQGRRELRYAMIEAAWNAVKYSRLWRHDHERAARMRPQKPAVAIARKLLVTVWHVLTKRQVDRRADLNAVGKSMLVWGWKNQLAVSLGMKPADFTRQQLDKLGIHLEKVVYCSRAVDLRAPAVAI